MKYTILFVWLLCAVSLSFAKFISAVPAENLIAAGHNPLDEDACPPQTIVSLPLTLTGNTSTSANNYTPTCYYSYAPDDIYALSIPCSVLVRASLCGSSYDTGIEVRHGTNYFDCPGSTLLGCNDDYCGLQSQVDFLVSPGEFYFIIVDGYAGNSGAYTLNVTEASEPYPPVNDNCAGVITISSLPYQQFGSTACASNDFTAGCSYSNAPDVIYELLLPCGANVTATTCGHPLMDDIITVRSGGACPGQSIVTCNDDYCANYQSSVSFFAAANTAYYIIIDGYSTNAGYYVLSVTNNDTHPEDACPGVEITSFPATITGDTGCLNNDYPQSCAYDANEAVYYFTVPDCRRVTASLCGSSYDAQIEVHTGNGCPGDSLVICRDDYYCDGNWTLTPTVTFDAQPGYTYQILVGGYAGYAGAYTLSVDAPPCPVVPPVTDLVEQADIVNGNIVLNWSAVPGADYYLVLHSIDIQNWYPSDPCYGTTFTDLNVIPPDPIRFYQIVAVDLPEAPGGEPVLAEKPVPPAPRTVQIPSWIKYDYTASQHK